eukprot:CAMPEP_0194253190 /NCGR_PEP_ID=MMETSP0158-20130606/29415_1 /TAXON_ID=33649 /ORGANISM="Thalassionema nitzschioides, Strain L26-B" /LENGTH=170 /DNA_ID=CAMNT_0038990823 /DNA_START=26 /DNA_END=535 /DNA_ORIENTATION=+
MTVPRLSKARIPQAVQILTGEAAGMTGKTHSMTQKMVKIKLDSTGVLLSRMKTNVKLLSDTLPAAKSSAIVTHEKKSSGISISLEGLATKDEKKIREALKESNSGSIKNFQVAPSQTVAFVSFENANDERAMIDAGTVNILGNACQVALMDIPNKESLQTTNRPYCDPHW